jgi:hypothetical protein
MHHGADEMRAFMERELIDKTLVHKVDERNVFIGDLRRTAPKFIAREAFEANLARIAKGDAEFSATYYRLAEPDERRLSPDPEREWYVLRSLPFCLPRENGEGEAVSSRAEIAAIIKENYEPDPVTGRLTLRRAISEYDAFVINDSFRIRGQYIPKKEETRLSAIIETWDGVERENVYYANMHVDPEHEYYFEHPVEHIPAMMLIEAQRQFGLACCHVFGKIPVKGMQIILKDLNIEFFNYAELNYPVTIRGAVEDCRWRKGEYWTELKMDITFHQEGPVARFRFVGRSLELRLFDRLRERKLKVLRQRRFELYPFLDYTFSVKSDKPQRYYEVALRDISLNGFCGVLKDAPTQKVEGEFQFFIQTEPTGLINGTCRPIWNDPSSGKTGFAFIDLSEADSRRLYDLINRYSRQIEEREYLREVGYHGN